MCFFLWESMELLWLKMTHVIERVVRPPVMTLEGAKQWLISQMPCLAEDPLKRTCGHYHGLEIFGQSETIPEGFDRRNMRCEAFDCRAFGFI